MAVPGPLLYSILALLLVMPIGSVSAAETDQYLARNVDLEDSTDAINDYFNSRIEYVLENMNARVAYEPSCTALTRKIMWQYRLIFVHQVELWTLDGNADYYPPKEVSGSEYRAESIYDKDQVVDMQKLIPLSRTIRVGDTRFGIDKLGHFVSLGHKYFMRYEKLIDDGMDAAAAETEIIETGFDEETGMIGERVSGVISFADLEANYQGFLFVRSLCTDSDPRIIETDNGLELVRPLDIREYVNPNWDESINNNVYSEDKWALVSGNMQRYCSDLDQFETPEQEPSSLSANMQRAVRAERDGEIRPRSDYTLAQACAAPPPSNERQEDDGP